MNKKKFFIIIPAAAAVLAASFGVTYSYLVSNDSAVNEFTVGETEIDLREEYDPPKELKHGISFTKKPYVANTGDLPCYVRMRADFSDSDAEKFCTLMYNDTEGINSAYWEKNDADGYYYYNNLLKPGEETSPLFDQVSVKDGDDALIDFDILLYAEARQDDGSNYKNVWNSD